ncbi:hypothetical protein CYD30_23215 [Kosakonia cowanii]|nr:hypothetical protein CYD30_23215 [Kosakonia cowanii]
MGEKIMDILPDITLGLAVVIFSIVLIVVFIGIRNSVRSHRENEAIKQSGKETTALITHAVQRDSTEGGLILRLQLEFTAGGVKTATQKEIIVRAFNADEFKAGKTIAIRYMENEPTSLIIIGNATN